MKTLKVIMCTLNCLSSWVATSTELAKLLLQKTAVAQILWKIIANLQLVTDTYKYSDFRSATFPTYLLYYLSSAALHLRASDIIIRGLKKKKSGPQSLERVK